MLKYVLCVMFLLFLGVDEGWFLIQGIFGLLTFFYYIFFINLGYIVGVGYNLGCDLVSFGLVVLTFWISMLMFLASWGVRKYSGFCYVFSMLVVLLSITLMFCFLSMDMVFFYIFFESSLIPIFFLILGFGYQPERLQAGVYLLMYMLFSSFPLLIGILLLYWGSFSYIYKYGVLLVGSNSLEKVWYFSLVFAFLVKSPLYVVHLWLPKAHVEAPVSGSMILAGVLLKLGGYGLLRFLGFLSFVGFSYVLISISLVGGIFVSLMCLRQSDISSLVAYSSVVHMCILLGGLFTFYYWGLKGCMLLMIGHGLCSSGLFCLANIVYSRLMSRSILLISGVMMFMPSMCLWWFLFSICNMSAPPGLGLFGEICLIISMVSWNWFTMICLFFVFFLSACYSLYMYISLQHGSVGGLLMGGGSGYISEFLLLFLHWFPLSFMFLVVDYVLV